ncbi:MAG TPA: hypothetical protein VLA88_04120 [Candidatus Saccharimonadales bacterium]|nr:hypothetical protein [Candidatus Saccharimonadales bacterium]
MVSFLAALVAGAVTCIFAGAGWVAGWALLAVFVIAWIVTWFMIRAGKGDDVGDIVGDFFLVWVFQVIAGGGSD